MQQGHHAFIVDHPTAPVGQHRASVGHLGRALLGAAGAVVAIHALGAVTAGTCASGRHPGRAHVLAGVAESRMHAFGGEGARTARGEQDRASAEIASYFPRARGRAVEVEIAALAHLLASRAGIAEDRVARG